MPDFLTPDLCVIGGGAAGLAVARAARRHDATVVLIEAARLGGAALNSAALPAIALTAAGRRAHYLRTAGPFGITADEPRINARGVFDYVQGVVAADATAVTAEQLTAQGIEVIAAPARFLDRRTVEAGGRQIRARRFVLATGSRPLIPEIPGLAEIPYFTSASIFDNPRKLTHLVILGGSPVGLELAQALRRLGSEITLIDATPLAGHDPELADIALRRLRDEGVDIRAGSTVTRIEPRSLGIGVVVRTGEAQATLDASHILVATGRVPYLDGIEAPNAGILRQGADGPLMLRGGLRTSNRRVYAIGSVATAAGAEAVPAAWQAERLVRRALFGLPTRGAAANLPVAVFTDPEIARVGLDEPAARNTGRHDFRVLRISLAENPRARAEAQPYGLVKVLVDKSGRLLGAAIVGTGAAEMISLFAFAIGNGMSLRHFRNFTAPHPTLTEMLGALAEADAARARPESAMLRRLLALNRRLP